MPPPSSKGPPPPLTAPQFKPTSGERGVKEINMLFESIRQGKILRKTTIVYDRSAPIFDTKLRCAVSSGMGGSSEVHSNGLKAPPGLAGLVAGGMPKLKPIGSRIARNPSSGISVQSPKQHPQAIPGFMKPCHPSSEEEKKIRYGISSEAPKPPSLNNGGKEKPLRPNLPPKLLYLGSPPPPPMNETLPPHQGVSTPPLWVNRAQSMRIPKSNSTARSNPTEYRIMGKNAGKVFASAANQPQSSPPPRFITNAGGENPRSPLSPPSCPPPKNKGRTVHPSKLPLDSLPPLPIRVNANDPLQCPPFSRLPSAPLNSITINSPEGTPAARCGGGVILSSSSFQAVDLESKCRHSFHAIELLPGQQIYSGMVKTSNSIYQETNISTYAHKIHPTKNKLTD